MNRASLLLMAAAVGITGCAGQKFTRRYSDVAASTTAPAGALAVSFSTQEPPGSKVTIRGADLGAEAQAALVAAMVAPPEEPKAPAAGGGRKKGAPEPAKPARPKSAGDAIKELGTVLTISKPPGEFIDRSKVSRRLLIAVAHPIARRVSNPADRVQVTSFQVELPAGQQCGVHRMEQGVDGVRDCGPRHSVREFHHGVQR